jgi:transcriptional regulator with XRE-family HTH domain
MAKPKVAAKPKAPQAYQEEADAIGKRIAQMRDDLGITNEIIGRRMGITADGAKKIVGGNSTISFAKLKRLAAALGATPNEVLGVSDVALEIWDAVEEAFLMLHLDDAQAKGLVRALQGAVSERLTGSAALDPR